MSKLGRLKVKVGYEPNVARCDLCSHYKNARLFLIDSLPRVSPALCKKYGFTVKPMGVCNSWAGRDGSILDLSED